MKEQPATSAKGTMREEERGWADDERRDAEFIPDAAPTDRQAAARCGSNISASCVEKVFVSQTDSYVVGVLLVCSHSLLYCPRSLTGKIKKGVGWYVDAAPTLSSKLQFSASTMADVIGLIGRTNRVR